MISSFWSPAPIEPPNDDDDDDDGVIVVGGGEPAAHNSSEEEGPQPVVTPATSTVVAAMPPRHLSYASPQPTIQPALSSTSSQRRDGISEGGDSYTIGQIGSDCIPNDKDRVALMKDLTTQMSKHQMQCKTVDNAHQLKQNEHQLALSEHQIRGQIEVMETQHRMDMESKRLDADINASATSATVAANAGPAAAAAATAAALAAVEVPATAAAAAAAAVPAAAVNDYGLVCNFVSPTKTMPKHIELQNALNQCPFNHRFRQGNACSPNALYSKLRNYECNKTGCGIKFRVGLLKINTPFTDGERLWNIEINRSARKSTLYHASTADEFALPIIKDEFMHTLAPHQRN